MSKKKLLTVGMRKTETNTEDHYELNNFNMAWISSPETGRYQASTLMTCREYLCESMYGVVHNKSFMHIDLETDAPVDINRTRLLIANDKEPEEFKEGLFNGKALLNVYEKLAGFSSTSKIATVNHEKYGKQWLITGPPEWMKAGQLISAMTFLLRLATYNSEKIDTTDINTVEDSFKSMLVDKELLKKHEMHNSSQFYEINTRLRNFWDKMWVLTKFQSDLFSENFKENYKINRDQNFGVACGIDNLSQGTSKLPGEVDTKFAKLCETYLPRKNQQKSTNAKERE